MSVLRQMPLWIILRKRHVWILKVCCTLCYHCLCTCKYGFYYKCDSLIHRHIGNIQIYVDLAAFENACYVNGTSTACSTTKSADSVQKYLYVFMLANALHGAGSTPMFTLGTTYIDTNTKAKNTSFYLGIF